MIWIGPRGLFKKLCSGRPESFSKGYAPIISIYWPRQRMPRRVMSISLVFMLAMAGYIEPNNDGLDHLR